jgi:hypothetical protein
LSGKGPYAAQGPISGEPEPCIHEREGIPPMEHLSGTLHSGTCYLVRTLAPEIFEKIAVKVGKTLHNSGSYNGEILHLRKRIRPIAFQVHGPKFFLAKNFRPED